MNVDPGRHLHALARLTVSIRLAVSALVLTAILLTAALSSLLWWRTAEATSRQLASTINEQIVAAVRKEVAAIVDEARAAHTAIRTLFLQNVLDTREADKREFVFLSQLQSQATISWVAFGWPDGSFFAAHKLGDRRLEMMEISLTDHAGERRVDEYDVVPGDIEFANRRFEPTGFHVADQTWFKTGLTADEPQWFRVMDHPTGERPSIAFAGPIDVYQERQGVLAVVIEYTRLARFLSQLEVGRTGTAFIVDGSGGLIAAPDKDADELHPARGDTTLLPLARVALEKSGEAGRKEAWRSRLVSGGAAYEVALTPLPFPGWSLATVIPEAEFLGPVETTLRRLILGLAVGAVLAALASAMLARFVIAAPLSRVVGEIRHVEAFALEQVRRHPSRVKEIASLSGAIAEMASGLSAFRKFIPADLVRALLRQGVEAKPGGSIQELTVMFIDVAGFTGLSERLGDRVVPLLSRYLDITSEIIVANGGTIDKFIGDAVMAFWGAPQPQEDHAARCCRAALACRRAIEDSGLADDLGQPLQIRIGINSGRMLVGNIGSELRLNYTVIGDAVNVASRLEGANKSYGTHILIGEATERLARGAVVTREIDSIAVYGREEGLSVHELIGIVDDGAAAADWIAHYEHGLANYRSRRFAAAHDDFDAVLAGAWPGSSGRAHARTVPGAGGGDTRCRVAAGCSAQDEIADQFAGQILPGGFRHERSRKESRCKSTAHRWHKYCSISPRNDHRNQSVTSVSYTVPPNWTAGSDKSGASKNKNPNDPNMLTTDAYGSAFELMLDSHANTDGTRTETLTYKSYTGKTNGSFSATAETGAGADLSSAYQSLLATLQANGEMDAKTATQLDDAIGKLDKKSDAGAKDAEVSGGGLVVRAGGPVDFSGISAYQNKFVDSLVNELSTRRKLDGTA